MSRKRLQKALAASKPHVTVVHRGMQPPLKAAATALSVWDGVYTSEQLAFPVSAYSASSARQLGEYRATPGGD